MPILKNDERLYVYLQGNHFQENNVLTSSNDHVLNKNVVNIYIVYKLDPLPSTKDKSFTIQNALFGAMQITKNATDNDKDNYKGYGILTVCFYHVTYAFQSESTLYSCLNVKELLARRTREI